MANFFLDSEDIRNLLQNAHKIKTDGRCIKCDGTGWLNWNGENGSDVKSGRLTYEDSNRTDGECEDCEGVGFIW